MKRLLMFLFLAACAPSEATPTKPTEKIAPKARAARVEVATLRSARPRLDLVLPGEVDGSKDASLASPNGGYVERVLADVGDTVREGQQLAWVNKAQHEVQLAATKVQLDQAESSLNNVNRAGKSLPQSRRDAAEFAKQAADASYKLAEINARHAVVRAPFDGTVAARHIEKGEVLPPGGAVMRLVSLNPVHISISVSDQDVVALKKGMPATVRTGAQSTVYEGTVDRVCPAANMNTRTFDVRVEVKNDEGRLRPGMIATVRIGVEVEDTDQIAIPQYVLVTRLDGNGVFVEVDGVARWRPLVLGNVVRGQVVVKEGLAVGDRVVVTGHRELADQDRLLVAREGVCCTDGKVTFEVR